MSKKQSISNPFINSIIESNPMLEATENLESRTFALDEARRDLASAERSYADAQKEFDSAVSAARSKFSR